MNNDPEGTNAEGEGSSERSKRRDGSGKFHDPLLYTSTPLNDDDKCEEEEEESDVPLSVVIEEAIMEGDCSYGSSPKRQRQLIKAMAKVKLGRIRVPVVILCRVARVGNANVLSISLVRSFVSSFLPSPHLHVSDEKSKAERTFHSNLTMKTSL